MQPFSKGYGDSGSRCPDPFRTKTLGGSRWAHFPHLHAEALNASNHRGWRSTCFFQALLAKDAVFMSGHKFLGGAGTPGLLVGKRRLFGNKTPVVPAGGTVLFVMADDQAYLR